MENATTITQQEQVAILKTKSKKQFYSNLYSYLFFALIFIPLFAFFIPAKQTYYVLAGVFGVLGLFVAMQGLVVHEVFNFLTPDWEKHLVDKTLSKQSEKS